MPKAKVNGISINYRVQGKGEPLVLIMGYSGDQTGWMFQTGAFKKHYRVITFDNRGVGRSDKPEGPYSIRMMAEDTIGLIDHLGIKKAHVMGVSMGGYIAQELAINHPERVRKLVLGCTYACQDETGGHTSEYYKGMGFAEGCPADELTTSRWRNVGWTSPVRWPGSAAGVLEEADGGVQATERLLEKPGMGGIGNDFRV